MTQKSFWCLEAVFQRLRGVESVISGYMGGHVAQPSYRDVCEETTGHAEIIQIRFNPDIISYATLLEVFFAIHNPTTLNQQGHDQGTQYRSAIFYHSTAQQAQALAAIAAQAGNWPNPIVTEVTAASTLWPAEQYHQNYYQQNPYQPYCAYVIAPKIQKALHAFQHLFSV